MKKQKVLVVHNYYQIPGGEDTVVANEMDLLRKNGHQVTFYSRNNSELNTFSKLQKILFPMKMIFNIETYKDIRKIIREKKIDVVHVHNTLSLVSPAVYYAALKEKIPVVQTVHNFRLICPGAMLYRDGQVCEDCLKYNLGCAVKNKCYRESRVQTLACVMNALFHRATGIYGKLSYICLTDFNRGKLLSLKQIKEEQVFVKPNYVNGSEKVLPYSQRKSQFAYVGRLDELKGLKVLFEAWKLLGSHAPELIVCGTGQMDGWCRAFIKENQLNNIKMLGFISNADAKKIMAESLALILPTQLYEGFPMTMLEAFSVGTPVIGSDIGNVGNLVETDINGWKFDPKSPEELKEKVLNVKDIISTVSSTFYEKYSPEENYKALHYIYECVSRKKDEKVF